MFREKWLLMVCVVLTCTAISMLEYVRDGMSLLQKNRKQIAFNSIDDADFTVEEMNQRQLTRQKTLHDACKTISQNDDLILSGKPKPGSLYSKTYHMSVCDINKCGSTSWLQAILVMEGFYTLDDYHKNVIVGDRVIQLAKRERRVSLSQQNSTIQEARESYFKVITVRNPFHRVVSAYNGKMRPQSDGFTYVYGPLSRRIAKCYKGLRHKKSERHWHMNDTATFEDFVNFLLYHPAPKDPHWERFSKICAPCQFAYDFIVKFETLREDLHFLEEILAFSADDRRAFFKTRSTRTDDKMVEKVFRTIPKYMSQALYDMYKNDFLLFGYAKPDWLS